MHLFRLAHAPATCVDPEASAARCHSRLATLPSALHCDAMARMHGTRGTATPPATQRHLISDVYT